MDPRDDHDIGGHNEHRIDVLTRWLEHDGLAPEWSDYSDRLWWDDLRVVMEKRKDLVMAFIEKGMLFLGPPNTECVGELLDTEVVHANSELIQFLVKQARQYQNKEQFAKTISRCVAEVVEHYLWCGKDKSSEGLKTLEWLKEYHDLATRHDLTCMDYGRRRQVKDQGLAQVIAKSLIWLCENDDYEVPSSLLQAACTDLLDLVRQWGVDIDAGNPNPGQVNDPTQSPFASVLPSPCARAKGDNARPKARQIEAVSFIGDIPWRERRALYQIMGAGWRLITHDGIMTGIGVEWTHLPHHPDFFHECHCPRPSLRTHD